MALKILHVDSGRTFTAATDRTGSFALRDVQAGVYELTMSLPGFATVKATVDVRPGDRIQRSVVLPLGSIEETLTVIGGGPQDAVAPAPRPGPGDPAAARTGVDGRAESAAASSSRRRSST